jgi:hypothetical protein
MRSWKAQGSLEEPSAELTAFFSTPHGLKFLQKMVTAVMFVIEYGPSGVRGTQECLHLSGADQFVASSYGALQAYSMRMEQYIEGIAKLHSGANPRSLRGDVHPFGQFR